MSTHQLIAKYITFSPLVSCPQFLDGFLDMLHATLLPHRLGGEVAVGPRPIPISINGLGIKRDNDTKILRDPLEDIPEDRDFEGV